MLSSSWQIPVLVIPHAQVPSINGKLGSGPVWARECCRISPPRFLAECCKRQLNQGSFVLLYFRLFTFSDLYWVCLFIFSVKWLAVKTASEMTYIGSSGALNSTPTKARQCPVNRLNPLELWFTIKKRSFDLPRQTEWAKNDKQQHS